MKTIGEALQRFLEETGRGSSGSTASSSAVVQLFESYLNGWAHEDLNPFERQRFEQEYSENRRFCDIFDATRIKPHHLNAMVGHHAIRHGPSTKAFLKAVGPVMQKLAIWLTERRFWTAEDRRWYRELVGEAPGSALPDCQQFAHALHEYVKRHPIDAPEDLPDEDYLDDQFTIDKVEPGKLHLEPLLEGEEPIILALPKPVTAEAQAGWSVSLELARLHGKWRILGAGNVYP